MKWPKQYSWSGEIYSLVGADLRASCQNSTVVRQVLLHVPYIVSHFVPAAFLCQCIRGLRKYIPSLALFYEQIVNTVQLYGRCYCMSHILCQALYLLHSCINVVGVRGNIAHIAQLTRYNNIPLL